MKKLILLLSLLSLPVFAKDISDTQAWVPININAKLGDNLKGFLELQPRIGHDISSLDTAIVRPALGWKLDDHWTVWGGYLMQANLNKQDEYDIENRSWEGITYKVNTFEIRNRLEQRFLPNNADVSHRWRTRLRYEQPLGESKWSLITSAEAFVNLNDNDNNAGLRAGMNQVRSYGGVGYRFNPQFQVESGYLNQHVFNPNKYDQSNNVWMTSFNVNF